MNKRRNIIIAVYVIIAVTVMITATLAIRATEPIMRNVPGIPSDGIERLTAEPEKETESGFTDITVSEEEFEALARLVWLEARGESEECQKAVAEVIFNRARSAYFPDTVSEVIYQPEQFEPAPCIPSAETTDRIRELVKEVYENGNELTDETVLFFRADRYHSWSGAIDKFYIDSTYFSASEWCK